MMAVSGAPCEQSLSIPSEQVAPLMRLLCLGQAVAMFAHEINNPMTSVLGYASLISRRAKESEIGEDARRIVGQARRVIDLSHTLLEFWQSHSTEPCPTDLHRALEAVLAFFEPTAQRHNVTIVREFDDQLPLIIVYPDQIRQVLLFLISQSLKSLRDGGRLILRTEAHEQDNRPGVRVYGRAEPNPARLNREKSNNDGLRSALDLCHYIIERQGGHMAFYERPGEETFWVMQLPAIPGQN